MTETRPAERSDVKSLLEIATAVAGAGAFLSALMLYFGWVRTRVLFDYFGVPVGILQYTRSDYVLRSAEVFFKPAVWSIFALAALAAVTAGAERLEGNDSLGMLRTVVRVVFAAATLGCGALGMAASLGHGNPGRGSILLCLSGALVIVQYSLYRRHAHRPPPTVVLAVGVLLVLASAFWAVSIYAAEIGTTAARDIASGAQSRPTVVVHSVTDLGIAGAQGAGCPIARDDKGCRFSYSGYRLLAYTNQRWFLIRTPWSPGSPTIILLDNDSVRVELAA